MPTKTKFDFKMGMATREAFGKTLAKLGAAACERNNGAFRLLPMRSSHCGSVIRPTGVG